MHKHITRTQVLRSSLDGCIRLDPAFHGQMLATWHSFADGLYSPALVGWMGFEAVGCKLIYVVIQGGVCPGFATWQEARDFAAAAKQRDGVFLAPVPDRQMKNGKGVSTLHARRPTPDAQRSRVADSLEVV